MSRDDRAKATDAARGQKVVGCSVLIVLAIVLALWMSAELRIPVRSIPPSPPPPPRTLQAPSYVLEVVRGDWNWRKVSDRYVTAEGRVRNISGEPLHNVMAVVEFESEDGTFITSEDVLIDYDPLLPNQISPWSVIVTWNPAMRNGGATVRFRSFDGEALRTKVVE